MTKPRYVVVESTSLRTVVRRLDTLPLNFRIPPDPTELREFEETRRRIARLKRRSRKRHR